MLTQIINAKILTPQGWLKDGSVLMRDNKILEVTNCDLAVIGAELIDAKGMYVVPGGVEIHCHGGGGGDFMEGTEEAFRTAINAHMKHGTTSIFPTLSSSTVPMIEAAAETCTKLMAEPDSPVLGLHLEGHYLNIKMAGGQMPENIKDPDPNENTLREKGLWHLWPILRLNMKTFVLHGIQVIRWPRISIMRCPVFTSVVSINMKEQ